LIQDMFDVIDTQLLQTRPTAPPPVATPELFRPERLRRIGLLA
jgi:hypothetical protein